MNTDATFHTKLKCPKCGVEYDDAYRPRIIGRGLAIMQWKAWRPHTTAWGERCEIDGEHIHAECRNCDHHWLPPVPSAALA